MHFAGSLAPIHSAVHLRYAAKLTNWTHERPLPHRAVDPHRETPSPPLNSVLSSTSHASLFEGLPARVSATHATGLHKPHALLPLHAVYSALRLPARAETPYGIAFGCSKHAPQGVRSSRLNIRALRQQCVGLAWLIEIGHAHTATT